MKAIPLVLFVFTVQSVFSQTWQRMEVDNAFSILTYGQVTRDSTKNIFNVACPTPSGYLTIERIILPDNPQFRNASPDILKHFAMGYIEGLKITSGLVDVLENAEKIVDSTRAANVLFRTGNGQLNEVYFLAINKKIYKLQFIENLILSEPERSKIFSSIRILR
jgi:hypothetical protein